MLIFDTAPCRPTRISSLPTSSNILNVSIDHLSSTDGSQDLLLVSTADRRLSKLLPDPHSCGLMESHTHLHQAPILSWVALTDEYLISTSMSGQVVLSSSKSSAILDVRKDHSKYVVKAATHVVEADERIWLATAGWDGKVHIYNPSLQRHGGDSIGKSSLNPPVATITLPTNPEALLFVRHSTTSQLILLLSRRDSTFLYYYDLSQLPKLGAESPPPSSDPSRAERPTPQLLGRQNLAPYSNAWIAFTPSAIAASPLDSTLVAIATSSVPHMKLIIVRLIFPFTLPTLNSSHHSRVGAPSVTSAGTSDNPSLPSGEHLTSRAANAAETLAREREAAAIILTSSTFAPQTPYSTPALAWRPDGTGIWVNGDDGVVRGIEAQSGKVVARLGGLESTAIGEGHEVGSKVRCLWAGMVEMNAEGGTNNMIRRQELVVSGGFDQKLIVWRFGE